jgi:glycosyltransferase involved in cell wall biosynthesis
LTDIPSVHVVLPNDIDDPATPSGGNAYDRHVLDGLSVAGWRVHEHPVAGAWPQPDESDRAGLAKILADLPDQALVLADGLVALSAPQVLVPAASRLHLVVLVHMPLDDGAEQAVLHAAAAVVTTSGWTRRRLIDRYGLAPERVHAAPPGVSPAQRASASAGGTRLLCVGAIIPGKGYDVVTAALAMLPPRGWSCVCVGTLRRDPGFVTDLCGQIHGFGLADRIHLAGPRTGTALDAAYAAADLLVLASRAETYGMVVTEALARGIPVLATDVGGVPEAVGAAADGTRPGILVPPGDPAALAEGLLRWLDDADLRTGLRAAALARRATLTGWSVTTDQVGNVLRGLRRE